MEKSIVDIEEILCFWLYKISIPFLEFICRSGMDCYVPRIFQTLDAAAYRPFVYSCQSGQLLFGDMAYMALVVGAKFNGRSNVNIRGLTSARFEVFDRLGNGRVIHR